MFTPTAAQWRTETIDLSAYNGFSDFSVAFVNKSGYGNRLFLDNINISLPCSFSADPVAGTINCFGDCNGVASVNLNGGTGGYIYQWDANTGNQTAATAINLCAGTYSVTITDTGTGCTTETTVTITEPPALGFSSLTVTDESAVDANDGTATAVGFGGTGTLTYAWSGGGSGSTVTNLAPGMYTVTVFDENNCQETTSFTVNEYVCPDLDASILTSDVSCNGGNDGSIEIYRK